MTERMTAEELVKVRERHGMSQDALAAALGLHRNIIVSWETLKAPPIWLRVWWVGFEYQKAMARPKSYQGEVISEVDFLTMTEVKK